MQGPQGPPGPSGVSGYTQVQKVRELPPQTLDLAQAICPAGTKVLGGSVYTFDHVDENGNHVSFGEDQAIEIKESAPPRDKRLDGDSLQPRVLQGAGY